MATLATDATREVLRHFDIILRDLRMIEPRIRHEAYFCHPSIWVGDQPFIAVEASDMVFRLPEEVRLEAWQLQGSHLWKPSGSPDTPPSTEWVRVHSRFADRWPYFAEQALSYAVMMESGA